MFPAQARGHRRHPGQNCGRRARPADEYGFREAYDRPGHTIGYCVMSLTESYQKDCLELYKKIKKLQASGQW